MHIQVDLPALGEQQAVVSPVDAMAAATWQMGTQPLPHLLQPESPGVTLLEAELREITAGRAMLCSNGSTRELLAEEVRTTPFARRLSLAGAQSRAGSGVSTPLSSTNLLVSPPTRVRQEVAASKIQAAARGRRFRVSALRKATEEIQELRQKVEDYERHVLPQIVAHGAVRQATLRSELVVAQTAMTQSKLDRMQLSSRVHEAEAEAATLRSELANVTVAGRRGRGGG